MTLKTFIFILSTIFAFTISEIHAVNKCGLIDQNALTLTTLNGKIVGNCINYPIFYANKPASLINSVLVWHSIPYAQPPIGQLRFKDPQPVNSWKNIRDGTKMSSSCIQYNKQKVEGTFSEDCLYLNIATPYESYVDSVIEKNTSSLLPIFVWIHGGGFIFGGAVEYDGGVLASISNVIVITINYRLGVFGSLYVDNTDAKGYQSLKDQQQALKWIYENAHTFGGDKKQITICGESAGSWSVGYHLLLKQSWPYFKNAILQSGVPSRVDLDTLLLSPKEATITSYDLGESLGCKTNNNLKLLNCLQNVGNKKLNNQAHDLLPFPIFVKNVNYFNELPLEYLKRGEFKKSANVMAGFTNLEYLSLAYMENTNDEIDQLYKGNFKMFKKLLAKRLSFKQTNDARLDKIIKYYIPDDEINNVKVNYFKYFVDILSDFQYKCPTYLFGDLISKYNQDHTYIFEYAHKALNSEYQLFDGAAHADEIPFMFGNTLEYYDFKTYSKIDKLFTENMVDFWSNFIIYDKPTIDNTWKSYNYFKSDTIRNLYYLDYNNTNNVNRTLYSKTCQFWDSLNIITYRYYF